MSRRLCSQKTQYRFHLTENIKANVPVCQGGFSWQNSATFGTIESPMLKYSARRSEPSFRLV